MVTTAMTDDFAKAAAREPLRPRARWGEPAVNMSLPFEKPHCQFTLPAGPFIADGMLGAGSEKSPTDRFQKARYRLVTLVNHAKLAGERTDADRLSFGWKIGQHRRPPDRLEP